MASEECAILGSTLSQSIEDQVARISQRANDLGITKPSRIQDECQAFKGDKNFFGITQEVFFAKAHKMRLLPGPPETLAHLPDWHPWQGGVVEAEGRWVRDAILDEDGWKCPTHWEFLQ